MIELDQHEGSYLSICKHYRAIYNTQVVKDDTEKRNEVNTTFTSQVVTQLAEFVFIALVIHQVLKCVVLYLILAPFDNEQSDLIHRVKEDKTLEELPLYL